MDSGRGPRRRRHTCTAVGAHKVRGIISPVGEEIAAQDGANVAAPGMLGDPEAPLTSDGCIGGFPASRRGLVKRLISASSEHAIDVVEEPVAKHVKLRRRLVMSILSVAGDGYACQTPAVQTRVAIFSKAVASLSTMGEIDAFHKAYAYMRSALLTRERTQAGRNRFLFDAP